MVAIRLFDNTSIGKNQDTFSNCLSNKIPLLDNICQNSPEWNKKQKRAYSRLRSGFRIHKGERLRFISLTSKEGMVRDINEAYGVLVKRIRRIRVIDLVKQGYLHIQDIHKFYPGKKLIDTLRFEYFKVRTNEGQEGVLHIIYVGDYIPQKWLSDNWKDITGVAYIVDIRACKEGIKNTKRLAKYCISQYITGGQGTTFERYSWSWGWIFRGAMWWWRYYWWSVKWGFSVEHVIGRWNDLIDFVRETGEIPDRPSGKGLIIKFDSS